jgi:hypothetical protein
MGEQKTSLQGNNIFARNWVKWFLSSKSKDITSKSDLVKIEEECISMYYENLLKRIDRACRLIELNEHEPVIFEKNPKEHLFEVRSSKEKSRFYRVDADIKTCTCPDFNYRFVKCKHIIAAEFASGVVN